MSVDVVLPVLGQLHRLSAARRLVTRPHGGEIPDRTSWPADLDRTNPELLRNITPDEPVELVAERVLIAHQRRDIKGCRCGTWGSDHGHMGQSHGVHVLAELRAAGLELVRVPAEAQPGLIAAALAAEREKARAPFLALADDIDTDADVQNVLGAGNWKIAHLIDVADRIRRAAEAAQ